MELLSTLNSLYSAKYPLLSSNFPQNDIYIFNDIFYVQQSLTFLKLGGSVITDKATPYTVRKSVIQQIARELKKYKEPLVIAHGAGSFAHTSAEKYGGKKGYLHRPGLVRVSYDVRQLNTLVMEIFVNEGLPVLSFTPMSMLIANNGKKKHAFFSSLEIFLSQGFIPVVCGDVIADTSWLTTIYSGEKVLRMLTIYLKKKGFAITRVIELTDTNGVYDANNQTIPVITQKNWNHIASLVQGANTTDVTGGMRHKVEEALVFAKMGIPTSIINGLILNNLSRALVEKNTSGTRIF